jgi:hypothetical protein
VDTRGRPGGTLRTIDEDFGDFQGAASDAAEAEDFGDFQTAPRTPQTPQDHLEAMLEASVNSI